MNTVISELHLPRSQPEQQGLSSTSITGFLEAVHNNNLELHSFMLLRHGHVVAEGWWSPYKPNLPHMLFSLSKSFTSSAIGFAVSERLLSLDDIVISFFPEDLPEIVSTNLAQMTIRHLLIMGTGHIEDTMPGLEKSLDGNWVKAFLEAPVTKEPGTHFLYNTGATYMLSAILQKVAGRTLLEFLKPRLFLPLGIVNAAWETCPRGINTGGFGLKVTTEDIAKFGQLYLQEGVWNGQVILDENWIKQATTKQISSHEGDSDWSQGYGFQFWQCRHGAYRADGAFGQFCVVLPEQDAVVAITSGTDHLQGVLDAVWEHLLPAMTPEALPENAREAADVAARLSKLMIALPVMQAFSSIEQVIGGKIYKLDDNELQLLSVSYSFTDHEGVVTIQAQTQTHVIHAGRGEWIEGTSTIIEDVENRVMSSFTWSTDNILQLTLLFNETPFRVTVDAVFEESTRVVLKQQFNLSMEEGKEICITGRA